MKCLALPASHHQKKSAFKQNESRLKSFKTFLFQYEVFFVEKVSDWINIYYLRFLALIRLIVQEGWRLENEDIADSQSKLVIKGINLKHKVGRCLLKSLSTVFVCNFSAK